MSDPSVYDIPTPTLVECTICDQANTCDIFDDIQTGRWHYEFECMRCGAINRDEGNSLDRGSSDVLFTLLITGVALVVLGILGHSEWSWPLILGGGWLVAVVFIIALFIGANRKDLDS